MTLGTRGYSSGGIGRDYGLGNKESKGCKCLHMTSLSVDPRAMKKYYNKKKFEHSRGIRERMPEPLERGDRENDFGSSDEI